MGEIKVEIVRKKKKNEIPSSGLSHCMVLMPLTKMNTIRRGNVVG